MRKKFLLMIFVLSLFTSMGGGWLHAQTKNGVLSTNAKTITLFEDGFEDDFTSLDEEFWTLINADENENNWYLESGKVVSLSYSSKLGGELTPDNYIVTKNKYQITESSVLTIESGPYSDYIDDTYSVVISEDNEVWIPVFSENFSDQKPEQEIIEEEIINLGEYSGKNVHIGVRHYYGDPTWGNGIKIDYIKLTGAAPTAEPVAKIGETPYNSLDEAVAAAQNGETITLVADVELTAQVVIPEGKVLTLDLNGKTVNSVFNGNSTTNHIYALSNKGTLTINDSEGNGSINSRGIYNYGSLTLNAGAINAIDGNGGYAVNNQSGSTFVMNGGVVAATNEDDHQSSSGGYDATALKVPAGCTATLNGGTINNVCDFTYAIDAAGTLNIPETSTITVNGTHGAIYVSGGVTTIDAGTYTIPKDNYSRTDNVLYVSGGSLVVNGGTFIGDSDTASGGSCLYDEAGKAVVNGGTFKGSSGGDVWGTTGTTIKGGTFENLIEKQHIAAGYELKDGTVVEKKVAEINGVEYATLAAAVAAVQEGETITLIDNVVLAERVTIPADKTLTIDLNGKSISMEESIIATAYAINNLGNLTITDGVGGGSINARGIYNGYGDGAANVATAKITVVNGTINAKGTNGGGAAIFNYGVADIQGGTFTSVASYAIALQTGSTMTIGENAIITGGINSWQSTLTITGGTISNDKSGKHVVYAGESAVTINGGTFHNNNSGNATIMASGSTAAVEITGGTFTLNIVNASSSYLIDATSSATYTISGGSFTGGIRAQGGTKYEITGGTFTNEYGNYNVYEGGDINISGGTFTGSYAQKFATDNLAAGYELGANGTVAEVVPAAKIGETPYTSFADALNAAKSMTGDVTVEIYEKVTMNQALAGSYNSIKFVGKDTDAEIYLDVQGYTTATGKKVAFNDLKLSKSEGGFIANAGFMNVAFGIFDVDEVSYTNCTFLNGACASFGKVTYTNCIFKKSWDKYGLWAYGNVDITVDGCTFADYRGIKMYAENGANASVEKPNLIVKNTNFSAVNNKPAIVLTYGESVQLAGNTYSTTGVFELDLDGKPNGVAVTSDVAPTCINDNGECGVLVDGKIYTTVAQAAEVATSTSTVTLLHNSTETVELPMGVILDKNGFEANGVTVVVPVAQIGTTPYTSLDAAVQAAKAGDKIQLLADADLAFAHTPMYNNVYASEIDLNGKTLTIKKGDVRFDNVTIKNGNIVVEPGTYNGTAIFLMYSKNLAFDAVKVTATGVASTYLIGLEGTSNLVLENNSEIVIKNESLLTISSIIADNGNGNNVTIKNSKIDIENTNARLYLGGTNGNITVEDSDIDLNGVKDGFYLRAGQTLAITGNSTVDITLNSNEGRYGINLTDITATYTKAETATVNATVYEIKVAKVGENTYRTLAQAVAAVEDGGTITLIANETFTKNNRYNNGGYWDGLGYSGDKSFTIDLGGFTVSQDGSLNDYLFWFKNVGSKENTITIKNGTLDAGTTAFCALCTASSHENKLTINTENLTLINNISNGSTVKVRAGSVLNVKEGTKITGKNSYLGIENWNATVNIYDGAEIYMNGTSSYNGCLVGVGGNGTVNVYGGYGKGVSGGIIAMTSGGTINVAGGEWIANTDGTYANSNKSVLIAQSDKQYNAGAGNAVVNVTGGTFKGGYNCYGNKVGDAQINISGGNFNSNPSAYVKAGYVATEAAGIYTVVEAPAYIDGKASYASIAAAYEAAVNGDVIVLNESVTTFPVINKAVTFKGGKENAAVEINYALSQNFTAIDGTVRFENLTFNKPLFTEHGGNKPALSIEFEGCNFNVNSEAGYGILIGTSWSNSVVKGLKVNNCNFKYVGDVFKGGYMLYVQCVNEVTITNNTIDGNNLYRGAIHLGDATEHATVATVSNNTIKNFCRGVMMGNRVAGSSATISNNTFDNINYSDKDNKPAQECAPIFIHSNATAEALQIALTDNKVENCANPMIYSEDTDLIKYYVTEFTGNTVGGTAVELANSYNAPNQVFPVATINDAEYFTLQAAINAVKNGETITVLRDIATNVEIKEKDNVKVTIDGNGMKMTGTIKVVALSSDNDRRITIKNFKFEDTTSASVDFITSVETNHYPRITVEGCTFTGSGDATDVALRLKSSKNVEIKNCTGTGLHSFLQNTSGWNLTIENVTVTESKSGLALGTVQGVTVKGSNIDVAGYGIRMDANTYNNNAVIENNTVEAFIPVVVRKANTDSNITFQGTNTFSASNTDNIWCAIGTSEYEENGKLPTDATGKVTVTLNDNGLDAAGVYGDYVVLAGEGTEDNPYLINTLKELEAFRNSVNKGETKYNAPGVYVALNADINLAGTTWERGIGDGINATFDGIFDGRNKTIKNLTMNPTPDSDGYVCGGLFGYIYGAATIKNLVIENATITAVAERTNDKNNEPHNVGVLVGFAYNKNGKANISNITVKGDVKVDAPNVDGVGAIVGYSYYPMGTIDNCKVVANEGSYIKGYSFVGGITGYSYSNAVISNCSVENLAITATSKGVGGIAGLALDGNNISGCTVANTTVNGETNVAYIIGELGNSNGNVIIENCTAPQPWVGGAYATGEPFVATIGTKYYTSIKDAIKAVKDNETIVLIRDITMDYNARDSYETQAQNIVIDGNDHTLTLNQKNSDWASIGLANNSKLVLNNMTIEKTGYGDTNGAWNTHAIIFSCPLEMNDVIVNNAIAVQAGAILNNVAINEANGYYGLWINGNGQSVTMNGGSITATNGGRGIKIADQYIDAPAQVTLNVTGTDFNTAKKAAVLVSSKAGAQIVASNVDITDVVADDYNFVWVDEDWAANYGNVEVTGAEFAQEGIENFVAAITKGANVEGYYKTLQAAINAVQNGESVTLIKDVAENVTLTEKTGLYYTIDGADKTMNGTITVKSLSDTNDNRRITIKNINFVDTVNGRDFITSTETNHYPRLTVESCSFTGTGKEAANTVAVRLKSSHSVVIKDCTGTGLHSFLQNTSGWNLTIENVTVTESKSGLALGTVQGVTVKGSNIDVAGYGIRMDANTYNNNAVIESNTVKAFIPVVVRKANTNSNITFNGTNTMTATNTDGYWCVIGTSEYEENGQLPTAATGNVFVSLNDEALNYEGIYGHYAVAQIGDVKYATLQAAVNAVEDGGTITLIADEVFTKNNRYNNNGWWDGLGYSGDKSFTIDLGGYTISQNGDLNDYLIWIKNDGAKANTITLKNGTLDAGTTAYCALATASSNINKITINTSDINFVGNNSSGAVLKIRGGAELNANAGTIITGYNNYVGIEVVGTNTVVNINEGVEIYQKGTGSYVGSLAGVSSGATLNVIGGKGTSAQGGFIAMTSGGTINVSGGEWIANTDGTYANSNKSVLVAQSNKQYNAGAGNSIINVTGGTFKGGYNCYGNAAGDAQINISGGNFNADPTTYVVDKYEVVEEANGTFTVKMASFEKFYTATGVETTTGGVFSLAFEPTSETEVSVKIGSKNPAVGKNYDLIIPSSVEFNGVTFAVTSIPEEGFKECKGFDKLVVPGTITSVSANAFYSCSRFKEITIEEGVQKLGANSFYKNTALETLTLPSTLTRIESLCFRGVESTNITIVCNAMTPPTAFEGSFTQNVYNNALLYVAGTYEDYKAATGWKNFVHLNAQGATQVIVKKNYTLIATITDVWNRTCSVKIGTAPTNTKRAQLEIPEHVSFNGIEFDITSIPESGFQECKYFEGTLTIPAYITSIGRNAFNGCSGITELVVEEGITSLGTYGTFEGCRDIETIILPSTLKTIPTRCFQNIHQNLNTIVCNAMTPPTLSSNFSDHAINDGLTLYVHDVDAYKAAARWNQIKSIRLIGAVAQNMTTSREYKSLQEAINEAAGATVKVLDNVVLEEAITVAAGAEVTLDLNGKVVSYESAVVGEDMITNNGKLTVESSVAGGKITYNNTDETGANVTINTISTVAGSELIINGGIIENTSLANNTSKVLVPYAIDILTNGGLGDVAVTINGGEIVSTNYIAIRQFVNGNVCNNSLTVKGGTITGLKRAINVQDAQGNGQVKNCAKLLVEAGDIIAGEGGYAICNFANSENVALTGGNFVGTVYSAIDGIISGGTFSEEPYSGYLADGFICEPNADGTYSVIEEPIYTQTIQLNAGWNWFSSYVETDLESLQTALRTSGVMIKTGDYFNEYLEGWGWDGNIESVSSSQMYMIQTSVAHELVLSGKLLENVEITLNNGWNWISFPMNTEVSVTEALANLQNANTGDIIKNGDAFAEYLEGWGWDGTLSTLEPGQGYMYYSNNETPVTFTYSPSSSKSEAKANVTTDGNYWTPNAAQFANNMTMTAVLDVENINYEVAAFVNGECRGSARPIYVEALDAYMLFLTIHGEEVEEMTFKYYDIDTDTEYTLSDRINYSNNAILGSLKEPYMFTRGTTGIGEAELSQLNIYPNPTTTAAEINLNATFDKVEVFNALGVKVAEYSNVDSIDALETAGIYVIRATNNSVISHCRLVVK